MVVQANSSIILKEPHTVGETADYDVSYFERAMPGPGPRPKDVIADSEVDWCKGIQENLTRNGLNNMREIYHLQ